MSMLDDAIQAIRTGNPEEGRRLLEEILEVEENNEQVWLWLTAVVDNDEDREVCLENVLALDPNNVIAQKGDGPEAGPVVILSTHYDSRVASDRDADEEEAEG